MAAVTAGYEWSRSSPLRHSPGDIESPMFPDRPIRPLPKRRLRTRLSPEQAQSSNFVLPEPPASSGPLFSIPYSQIERPVIPGTARRQGDNDHHVCHCGHGHTHSDELESEGEEEQALALQASPSYQQYARGLRGGGSQFSKYTYDSSEHTSNTKKRKIPNAGGIGGHQRHHTALSEDMENMGISQGDYGHDDDGDIGDGEAGPYYGSGGRQDSMTGTGLAGAGRGRYARSSPARGFERRVLGASSNALNAAKANGKRDLSGGGAGSTGMINFDPNLPDDDAFIESIELSQTPEGDAEIFVKILGGGVRRIGSVSKADASKAGGIISAAIAHAQAEQSQAGNENVNLLQQQAAKAGNGKFSFTCPSDSANKMAWPEQQNGPYPSYQGDPRAYPSAPSAAPRPSQIPQPVRQAGTQRPTGPPGSQVHPNATGAKGQPQQKQGANNQQAQQPRKPKRSPSKMYALAARQRRLQKEYDNFHHPPTREDIWICEFCEYESIFGSPPTALIRQYEIKDRKERKRLAEKRRLLEKARMKGRKGKKASKNAKNNANNNQQNQNQQQPNRNDAPVDDGQWDGHDDDYYLDEDDVQPPAPGTSQPHSCGHPQCTHAPVNPPPPGVQRGGGSTGTT